ncbi:tumor necrosis factor receptor superfamily member 12A [Hoplias malabaricus]|uniref:tumor necrosis factor receptor superfamily member 12A n=1 Tax=Hoplias malabaricus TaxID=27720 RepID=UPI0034619212
MDLRVLCRVLAFLLVSGAQWSRGVNAEKTFICKFNEVFNIDIEECVQCSTCIQYPKTPSCDKCPANSPLDSWRVAAITSFSVLAAVVVFGGLLIVILVHQCRSRRTLREPIEETTGPLYPV